MTEPAPNPLDDPDRVLTPGEWSKRAVRRSVGFAVMEDGYRGCNHGAGSYDIKLGCGHRVTGKWSQRPRKYAWCRSCFPDAITPPNLRRQRDNSGPSESP